MLDSAEHPTFTPCMHGFCQSCIIEAVVVHGEHTPRYNARTLARAEANLEQKARAEAKTEHHWQKMQTCTTTTKSSSSTCRRKRQRTDTSSSQEESGDDGEMMTLRELVQTQTTMSWVDKDGDMTIG